MISKEDIALFCKEKEIEALEKTNQSFIEEDFFFIYWDAKAQAFNQVWEYIVFDGKSVPTGEITPQEYNKQNEIWSKRVQK